MVALCARDVEWDRFQYGQGELCRTQRLFSGILAKGGAVAIAERLGEVVALICAPDLQKCRILLVDISDFVIKALLLYCLAMRT